MSDNSLWLFIEHGPNRTWTRALLPKGVSSVRDLIGYLQHGGRVVSDWIDLPDRFRLTPRVAGLTVIARLEE